MDDATGPLDGAHSQVSPGPGHPSLANGGSETTVVERIPALPWTVASRDLTPPQEPGVAGIAGWLAEAASLGADGLLLPSVTEASPNLDRRELAEVRSEAQRAGLKIEACFGPVHPQRLNREEAEALLRAGEELGVEAYHLIFGLMEDRFATNPSWSQTLAAAGPHLTWVMERMSATPVFRTHEEMTTFELLTLLDAVGNPDARIGFSPANVITRLEDPWEAFLRVEHVVRSVFLDDAKIVRIPGGLSRRMCLFGEGALPWSRIFAALSAKADVNYIVDIHRAEFDMPMFDLDWLDHQPDLTARELVTLLQNATDAGDQESAGVRGSHLKSMLASVAG